MESNSEKLEILQAIQKELKQDGFGNSSLVAMIYKWFRETSEDRSLPFDYLKEIFSDPELSEVTRRKIILTLPVFYRMEPDFVFYKSIVPYVFQNSFQSERKKTGVGFLEKAGEEALNSILPKLTEDHQNYIQKWLEAAFIHISSNNEINLDLIRIIAHSSERIEKPIRIALDFAFQVWIKLSVEKQKQKEKLFENLLWIELYLIQESNLSDEVWDAILEKIQESNNELLVGVGILVLVKWLNHSKNGKILTKISHSLEKLKTNFFPKNLLEYYTQEQVYYLLQEVDQFAEILPFLREFDQKKIRFSVTKPVWKEIQESQESKEHTKEELKFLIRKLRLFREKCESGEKNLLEWNPDRKPIGVEGIDYYRKTHEQETKEIKEEMEANLEACLGLKLDFPSAIEAIEGLANYSRRMGILALEDSVSITKDPFLSIGLQAICDGTDPENVKMILEPKIERNIEKVRNYYQMLCKGILEIQEGTNPRVLRLILESYI